MSRQDKATTERNARTLRELVKQPDNKSCADCRKNDARWASWNLGVFLCIRCSGIHRSMGTHISKVKSIDLDMWTPEQMDSVQKWGNKRANLYWEKHLKAGHVPPDHKIESFIRSKYESNRWAMDGPPPSDPAVLERGGGGQSAAPPVDNSSRPTPTSTSQAPAPAPAGRAAHPLLSRQTAAAKATPAPAPIIDLMGGDDPAPTQAPPLATALPTSATSPIQAPAATTGAQPPAATAAPTSSIFDLDFRAPTPSSAKPQTNKTDIMSLFSTPTPSTAPPQQNFFSAPNNSSIPAQNPYASWGGGITSTQPAQQAPTQAPVGANAGWGGLQMDQSAWGSPAKSQQPQGLPQQQQYQQQFQPAQQQQGNLWAGNSNASADPWASTGGFAAPPAKKEEADPFANIWK